MKSEKRLRGVVDETKPAGPSEPAQGTPGGYWRYVGDGTRITGVPRRDLTPNESELYGQAIREVVATGTVLYVYVWPPGAAATAAPVEAPVYETTTTATVWRDEQVVWAPSGGELKEPERDAPMAGGAGEQDE